MSQSDAGETQPKGRYVVWFESDVDESGNVRPAAISELVDAPNPYRDFRVRAVGSLAHGADMLEVVITPAPTGDAS